MKAKLSEKDDDLQRVLTLINGEERGGRVNNMERHNLSMGLAGEQWVSQRGAQKNKFEVG